MTDSTRYTIYTMFEGLTTELFFTTTSRHDALNWLKNVAIPHMIEPIDKDVPKDGNTFKTDMETYNKFVEYVYHSIALNSLNNNCVSVDICGSTKVDSYFHNNDMREVFDAVKIKGEYIDFFFITSPNNGQMVR